jgi:exodeoxyribonuclease III
MRIVSWNIERWSRWLTDERERERRHLVEDLGAPDVLCLQELEMRADDADKIARAHAALRGYDCFLSLPRDRFNVTYRGGRAYGVATYVRSKLRAKGQVPDWDREGRVVITSVGGIAIVNVYLVNGTSRPWFDPETGERAGDRHSFKRALQRLVLDEAAKLGDVVVVGDFNVSRSKLDVYPRLRTEEPHATARRQLNERIEELGFVDVFRALHPTAKKYTWFARGAAARGRVDGARVDYALVSPSLAKRVTEADIDESRANTVGTDHAPLFIEIVDASLRRAAQRARARQ